MSVQLSKGIRNIYRIFIKPKSSSEDSRRRELIFNVIAFSLFVVVCLIDLSVLYADIAGGSAGTFDFFSFSVLVAFFGGLVTISRKGHFEIASYLFVGFYFMATTWGVIIWGFALPLALLSYGAIIIMTNVLFGTRVGFATASVIIVTDVGIGYLETHGIVKSDISWRYTPLRFKDVIEDSFIFLMVSVISWLSNRETERSLVRAQTSEKALKEERDLLEVKVEERTRELKAAEIDKISQLYRFIEFGRLASGIFRDLMNPLSAVAVSVEQLHGQKMPSNKNSVSKDQEALQAEASECIERAVKAAKRMESFMQTARKQLDSREQTLPFSANCELLDAINLLVHKSRTANVEIRLESSAREIFLRGNPVKFFQIAVNLISNAIDSYDGKKADEKTVLVSLSTAGCNVILSIEDTGCGIKKEFKKAIFDPFFTTKMDRVRRDSGLGLGLSTTKDMVEKDFGGSIELESEEGKGSKFKIVMPLERKAR